METINERYEMDVPIDELKLHPANDREGNVEAISDSLTENGFYGAIVAQTGTGYIVKGNHTFKALIEQGAKTVPAVIWIGVDDDRALAILLADNHIAESGSFNDLQTLRNLKNLKAKAPGMLLGTGFTEDRIKNLVRTVKSRGAPPRQRKPPSDPVFFVTCPCCGASFTGKPDDEGGIQPIEGSVVQ